MSKGFDRRHLPASPSITDPYQTCRSTSRFAIWTPASLAEVDGAEDSARVAEGADGMPNMRRHLELREMSVLPLPAEFFQVLSMKVNFNFSILPSIS